MKKKIIEKRVIQRARSCSQYQDNRWTWGDVMKILMDEKITLEPTDILEIGYTEGWDEGDSMRDDMYDLTLTKCREETDAELESRINKKKEFEDRSKKLRYQNNLKLKAEFE